MQTEEVFDIADTVVLVLEESVVRDSDPGHTDPLNLPQTPHPTGGVSITVRSEVRECQFSPPVNASQHAIILPSPNVTLLGPAISQLA